MKRLFYFLIGGVSLCALLILTRATAQTSYSGNWSRTTQQFHLDNMEFGCTMQRSNVVASPTWSISDPIPLGISNAVAIARAELRKLASDEATWEVTQIALRALSRTESTKWYYEISFELPTPRRDYVPNTSYPDHVTILIDFAGRPGSIVQKPLGLTNSTERLSDRRL